MNLYASTSLAVSITLLANNPASAACNDHGLFAVPSIRQAVRTARSLPPAATEAPSPTAPQNLAELHDVMNDALVFALDRSQSLPGLKIQAAGAGYDQKFTATQLVGVPASITVTGNTASARVRYVTKSGTNATCYYKEGAKNYAFDYCTRTVNENLCALSAQLCRQALALNIQAGDTVIADEVQVPLHDCNGNSCSSETASLTLANVNTACEGLALSSVHLLENLNCSAPNHVALEMLGANNIFHGHGYAINSPGSEIGLFVSGDDTVVRHTTIDNVNGYALMAYDTNRIQVYNNRFRQNIGGVNIYTDNANTTGVQVLNNDISGSAFAALIFDGDGVQTKNPTISGNGFQNTGGYAVAIDASSAAIGGSNNNDFTGSVGALYLSNGNFTVSNLDLSKSGATGPQIFADTAQSITVTDSNLTYNTKASSADNREALHLYRVGTANVSHLTVTSSDVGFKATTEMGTSTKITLTNSTLTKAVTAAVMLESYDSTAFGEVQITGNTLTGAPAGYAIWQVGSTALGSGSSVKSNSE